MRSRFKRISIVNRMNNRKGTDMYVYALVEL